MAESVTNTSTKTYDYSTIGSFNSGGASSLKGDMINKIRAKEEEAVIDPITRRLENLEKESKVFTDLKSKISLLQEKVKMFDLFSSSNNVFEQVKADSTGTAATFDASDVGALKEGTYQVNFTQLAQQDIWQGNTNTLAQTEVVMSAGSITINGETFDTTGKTMKQLAKDITNTSTKATASLEQVGDDSYRLVIKSKEAGTANALSISESGTSFGFNDAGNHIMTAQNLQGTVNGVQYDLSSNNITVDGNLKITAAEIGSASLSLKKDTGYILPAAQELVSAYNEIASLINEEIYSADTAVENKSGLRDILNGIKNLFFNDYGKDDQSAFNLGFSFDVNGNLSLDSEVMGKALTENFEGVKEFFLGRAEDKGFGTMFKEYLDDFDSYNGVMTNYNNSMDDRKISLEKEKEKALENLDSKYGIMVQQFAAYSSIISQMEASFSGLKMMIQQSTASN